MSETKLDRWVIPSDTVAKLKDIASKFSELNTGSVGDIFWLIDQPDSDYDYEGDSIAVGINKKGELVKAYDSHCSCNGAFDDGLDAHAYGEQPLEGELTVDFSDQYLNTHDDWLPELKATTDTLYNVLNGKSVEPKEVIGLPNAEIRRAVVELVGYDKIVSDAEVLDTSNTDGDLLRIKLADDEDLVLLHVKDPSTTREYFLRVPPNMKTARQARAWTFGFEPEEFVCEVES